VCFRDLSRIVAHATDDLSTISLSCPAFRNPESQSFPSPGQELFRKGVSLDSRIKRVVSLIEEKPQQELSLAVLAEVAGLSPSRFRHKFKLEVGVTPLVYVQTHRLRLAKDLLTTHQLSVKEVKNAVGISSDSYFTHQFKRAFGIPPSRSRTF
jgi:transcriptional regulator GlxA family with amidase domain